MKKTVTCSLRGRFLILVLSVGAILLGQRSARAQVDLGLVGIRSINNRYLQAHTDGEMHASNEHRNEEETWHLVEVDHAKHIFALLNWRNHQFMSKRTNGCVPAVSTTITPSEEWVLVSGKRYGVVNAVAFKNVADGTYIGTNSVGNDDKQCGGEVSSRGTQEPPQNQGGWPGWWVIESATPPESGKDFWTTIGSGIAGVVSQIKPADVAALIAALAAG